MKIPSRPENAKTYSDINNIFSRRSTLLPQQENYICAHAALLSTSDGIKKRLQIKPCWVSNPQQGVATILSEEKGYCS